VWDKSVACKSGEMHSKCSHKQERIILPLASD
jgi:hypothetical protein